MTERNAAAMTIVAEWEVELMRSIQKVANDVLRKYLVMQMFLLDDMT